GRHPGTGRAGAALRRACRTLARRGGGRRRSPARLLGRVPGRPRGDRVLAGAPGPAPRPHPLPQNAARGASAGGEGPRLLRRLDRGETVSVTSQQPTPANGPDAPMPDADAADAAGAADAADGADAEPDAEPSGEAASDAEPEEPLKRGGARKTAR